MIRLANLKVILPGHVSVDMAFWGAINRCSMPLERRFRSIMIVGGRSLPLFHLDRIRRRKGDCSALNEGHQCHRP